MSESVAILFTDLVGSTALATRVGPEQAEELRLEHFGLLRAALAEHGGREVKNLGDGLMVVFGSPSSALAAGVAMQQAFEARNRNATEALEIRMAVSAGEADEEDGDFFGPPVVEAARLCAICDGGQLLTSALVKMFVGARGGFDFEPVGARELKGIDDPVEVLRVAWTPLTPTQHAGFEVPLPARLTPQSRSVFTGRTTELARLADAWKEAGAARRRVSVLGGEAGIGKTTLVSHFAAQAHADGAVVLYGRCDEDVGVPYQPWIEALETLIAHAPDDLLSDHVEARGGELARLVPLLSNGTDVAAPPTSDAEAERYALLGAVADLLSRTARRLPVVLVLDDLHWAEKSTVQLLRHIAAIAEPTRLMMIGTYRPSDIGAGHPLTEVFAPLRREAGVEFVDLAGLDDVELLELMELTAGHEMPQEGVALRDAIAAETNGNPFFATEILFHLAESGAIKREDGRWVTTANLGEHGLPVSVRQVVGERVARLGPDAEKLLRAAAVIGRDFDLGLLCEIADVDEDDALDVLDAAVAALLVDNVGPDRYSFAHALVEHTLYEDLTPSRRARTHRRIAEKLEVHIGADPGERVGELAYHWSAALVPDDATKAIDYARRAGDRGLAQLAPDEALRWYARALELHERHGGTPLVGAALLVGLGTAQRQTGDPAHRDTLLRAAQSAQKLGDADLLVAAALANHRGWASGGFLDHDKVAVLEAAIDAIGPADSPPRARLLAVLAAELALSSDPARRDACGDDAVAIARRLDAPHTLLAALIGRNTAATVRRESMALYVEAVTLAEELDDQVAVALSAATLVTVGFTLGDRELFEGAALTCTTASERVGQPELVWRSRVARFLRAIADGDLARAETLADEHLHHGLAIGVLDVDTGYGGMFLALRWQQGRAAELRDPIQGLVAVHPELGVLRAALLVTLLDIGDYDEARAGFEREAETGFTGDNYFAQTYLSGLSHACARLGDVARAEVLMASLQPYRNQLETTGADSVLSTSACLGMLAALLGRADEADEYFAEAIELANAFSHPFLVASTQLEWARVLLDRATSQRERARPLLDDALTTARRHGFAGIERDSVALLALLA
jgi:class 3 adenylate cyclase/tetratricopeptide (TPR) repeat protein